MVAVFTGLKWHLLTTRYRKADTSTKWLIWIGLVAAFALTVLLVVASQAEPVSTEAGVAFVTLFIFLQFMAWTVMPLVAFGVDETLDPTRFALLPLSASTLVRGLLAAAFIGWLPLVNLLFLIAAAFVLSVPLSILPVALICLALHLVLCVVVARAAATALSSLMNSRRGRDLGMVVGFGLFVLYMLGSQLLGGSGDGGGMYAGLLSVTEILGWTPPGAFARVPSLVQAGDWGQAGVALVIGLAGIVAGLIWWSRAMRRALESGSSMTESSAPAKNRAFGRADSSITGVVAARDLVLIWRDPMRRLSWLISAALAFGWPFLVFRETGAVYGVGLGAALIGIQAANQLALDGSGLWLHLVMIGNRTQARAEMLGHLLVVVIPGAVLVTGAVIMYGLIQDQPGQIPAALGVSLAAMLGAAAASTYLSASKPYGVPQSRKSMFASAVPDQKGVSFVATLQSFIGGAVVAAPAGVLAFLAGSQSEILGWAALVVGVGLGLVAVQLVIGRAAGKYLEDGPEIFALAAAGDRA